MLRPSDPLTTFQRRLGHRFRRRELIARALTHRSFAHERGDEEHYERLEFLGDAVLGTLAAEWVFVTFPDRPEGQLSQLKSYLVSETVLARRGEELELGPLLNLGVGEERSGGRSKTSLLADAMEALIGAVYLDGGLKAARKVVLPLLEEASERRAELGYVDAKTRVQELAQSRGWSLPEYRLVAAEGPDHRKLFRVECWVDGVRAGSGEGGSKKLAEQRAAAEALAALAAEPDAAAPRSPR